MAVRVRPIELLIGDSLQYVAHRELGDASRWRELAELNGLEPPYIHPTVDEGQRTQKTLVWGDTVLIPSEGQAVAVANPWSVYGVDPWVIGGQLRANTRGDLSLAGGTDNLGQALGHRIETQMNTYLPHPGYGCLIHGLLGMRSVPALIVSAAGFCGDAARQDPRVESAHIQALVNGDKLVVYGRVIPVESESPFDLNAVLTLS